MRKGRWFGRHRDKKVMTSSQQVCSFSELSLNEIRELVKFYFSAVLAHGIIYGICGGIILGVWIVVSLYWWISSRSSEALVSGGVGILILLLGIIYFLIFMPVVFTIEKYKKMITHKSKLKELLNKATRLDRTGDSVALLLQRMEEGVKVGCAGKYLTWPIEHRITEASEKLAVEYREGQEDLEELLVIASDFKYLVGRPFMTL